MSPLRRLAHPVAAALLVISACTRYEYRPVDPRTCPPAPQNGSVASVIDSASGIVHGRLVDTGTGEPVAGARITLRELEVVRTTEADGRFRFDALAPGAYTLEVRRIGYRPLVDSVRVRDDGRGIQLAIGLASEPLDGCPGFLAERVRKPWWKFW